MATLTAQMLIGYGHPNDDGINPFNYLFLSENSKLAWILVHQNVFQGQPNNEKIIWIPTVEHTIYDAMLMIAIYICKDKEIIEMSGIDINKKYVCLYSEISKDKLQELYEKCLDFDKYPKIILSIFKGSILKQQAENLTGFNMDLEILTPSFSRLYSRWNDKTIIEDKL